MINRQNHAYSAGIPLEAGDRYYAQDLGRDFYAVRDDLGSSILSSNGIAPGTAFILNYGTPTVDGVSPNTVLDIPAGGAVLPYSITVPNSYAAIPPTTQSVTVNLPINWNAFTIDVSTLGCTGTAAYKLYASYSEVAQKSRSRAKAAGTYNYEVLPQLSLGATTGSIPAGSVLIANFTYNSGSSPITLVSAGPVSSVTSMIQTAVTQAGLTWDPTDAYLLDKANVATSHVLGEDIYMGHKLTQVTFPNATSSANPSYPRYLPVIARDVDKTVTSTQAPNLVTARRAFKATILGNTDFSGTVSGATITFSITTTITAMLNAIINEGYVRRWFSSGQSANYAASGPDYTGMTVTINGTEYGISSISTGAGTITTTGSPTTGTQTLSWYPYRIAGSSTSIQLPRLSGFVPAGSDDVDGYEITGGRHMDQFQGHWQITRLSTGGSLAPAGTANYMLNSGASIFSSNYTGTQTQSQTNSSSGDPTSDGSDGSPRIGKQTKPATAPRFIYTWVDYLAATV